MVSVVVAYGSAYYRHWFTTQSESANWYLLVVHMNIGILIFALPITAYIGTGFDLPLLGLTNLPGLMRLESVQSFVQEDLHMLMITFMEPFADFHRHIGAALILPVLLAGHTTVALFHRFGA